MTITELITAIREDYLDDTFDGWESASQAEQDDRFTWSDAALFRYITEAEKQACLRTDFLYQEGEAESTITLVDGTKNYPISPKITFIEEVRYNDEPVIHVNKAEGRKQDLINIDNAVRCYSIRQRKIFFHPTPTALNDTGVVSLSVFHSPLTPITSEVDVLTIAEEYHRDLIWWVLYEAYSKQDADGYDKQRGLSYRDDFNLKFGVPVPSEVRLNQLQEPEGLIVRPHSYNQRTDIEECTQW